MANTPFKTDVEQTAANTLTSKEVTLRIPEGKNAYRVSSIKVQIDDFDVVVTTDMWKVQLSYSDKEGGSFDTIDAKDEILTIGEYFVGGDDGAGSPISRDVERVRLTGKFFKDGIEFEDVYIIDETFFINVNTAGQDAVEKFHIQMKGKYVNLNEDDRAKMNMGVSI